MHLPSVRADVVEELLVEVERLVGQLEIVMGLDMYGLCNFAAIRRVTWTPPVCSKDHHREEHGTCRVRSRSALERVRGARQEGQEQGQER